MGCCASASSASGAPLSEASDGAPKLMHTNSMLFPTDAMNDAKKSLRLEKPVDEASHSESDADDPLGILLASENGYVLGHEVEYAQEMSESLKVKIAVDGGSARAARELLVGYKTLQGRAASPPSKPNQDSVVVFKLEGKPNVAVFGVFDGHGPFGEHAAHFCRMMFHRTMKDVFAELGDDAAPEDVLRETIARVHHDFIHTIPAKSGVDPLVSGTTLIVALVKDDVVYVANVGDSRCILGQRSAEDASKAQVVAMSDDHKPERDSERARIEQTEAVLMSEGQLRGGSKAEGKMYICRAKGGQISYGVLFTRSIGDLDAHNYLGVSAEPEFKHFALEADLEQYLVLASDGIWDQMSNEQVMRKVFQLGDPLKASEQIAAIARDRWDNDRMHSRRDDITVCVVKLN